MFTMKLVRKICLYLSLIMALIIVFLISSVVFADTESMSSYINGTSVILYAQGNAFDVRDGWNAGGSWISR